MITNVCIKLWDENMKRKLGSTMHRCSDDNINMDHQGVVCAIED